MATNWKKATTYCYEAGYSWCKNTTYWYKVESFYAEVATLRFKPVMST